MTVDSARFPTSPRDPQLPSLLRLWLGLGLAPFVWALHELLVYFFATLECSLSGGELNWVRLLLSGLAMALCVSGFVLSYENWRASRGIESVSGDRSRFMSAGGMVLAGLFLFGVILTTIPIVFLRPCGAFH